MTTNPNNAIGTNAAYSGRTSVNAFNDDLAAYSRGILTGWNCQVDTGLTVMLGGGHSVRDVAIAEDNAGNKTTINNISLDEVPVTLDTAPGANSRIDAIVAYVDNPPQGSSSTADNPEACGIIPVAGTPAVDPQAPDDNAIRTAITADGASGTTAYYVVLATITIASGTTDLTSSNIAVGPSAGIGAQNIDFTTLSGNYSTSEVDTGYTWINGAHIYKKTIDFGALPNATTKSVAHNISNLSEVIKIEGVCSAGDSWTTVPLMFDSASAPFNTDFYVDGTYLNASSGRNVSNRTAYITLYYTKTNS